MDQRRCFFHLLAFKDNISSIAHLMKIERNSAESDLLSFADGSMAEPEVLTVFHNDGLIFRFSYGGTDRRVSGWGPRSLCLLKTYVIDPEVSAGPVVLFLFRDHLHGDVTISDGLFCEWPVVVTFYLGKNNMIFTNKSTKRSQGRNRVCAH